MDGSMVRVYTRPDRGHAWLRQVQGKCPRLALVLGFTETALTTGYFCPPGRPPNHRRYTALADTEFLIKGPSAQPTYPLPPLAQGASPVYITRAVVAEQGIPVDVFNAGLPATPVVPHIDLAGRTARCLTTGGAMSLDLVQDLWQQGVHWGKILATYPEDYLLLTECVVGGTTTALALLTGLGFDAAGKVNSSHPRCNHRQKNYRCAARVGPFRFMDFRPFSVSPGGGSGSGRPDAAGGRRYGHGRQQHKTGNAGGGYPNACRLWTDDGPGESSWLPLVAPAGDCWYNSLGGRRSYGGHSRTGN